MSTYLRDLLYQDTGTRYIKIKRSPTSSEFIIPSILTLFFNFFPVRTPLPTATSSTNSLTARPGLIIQRWWVNYRPASEFLLRKPHRRNLEYRIFYFPWNWFPRLEIISTETSRAGCLESWNSQHEIFDWTVNVHRLQDGDLDLRRFYFVVL